VTPVEVEGRNKFSDIVVVQLESEMTLVIFLTVVDICASGSAGGGGVSMTSNRGIQPAGNEVGRTSANGSGDTRAPLTKSNIHSTDVAPTETRVYL